MFPSGCRFDNPGPIPVTKFIEFEEIAEGQERDELPDRNRRRQTIHPRGKHPSVVNRFSLLRGAIMRRRSPGYDICKFPLLALPSDIISV